MLDKYSNFLYSIPKINTKVEDKQKINKNKTKISHISSKISKIRAHFGIIKEEWSDEEIECLKAVRNVTENIKNLVSQKIQEVDFGEVEREKNEKLVDQVENKLTKLPIIRECRVILEDIMKKTPKLNVKKSKNNQKLSKNIKNEPEQVLKIFLQSDTKKYSKNLINLKSQTTNQANPRFTCRICNKKFTSRCYLSLHMKLHQKKSTKLSFSCNVCSLKFTKESKLKLHKKLNHSNVNRQMTRRLSVINCNFYKNKFKKVKNLKNHQKFHNGRLCCEICNKTFSVKYSLEQHKKVFHENSIKFECKLCLKKFSCKGSLRRHHKIHDMNRPKPLKCLRCDYATDDQQNFKNHIISHERQDKKYAAMKNPLKCEKCPTFHRNKNLLNSHMRYVHPKVLYQCDLCAVFVKVKCNLARHMKNHIKKIQA